MEWSLVRSSLLALPISGFRIAQAEDFFESIRFSKVGELEMSMKGKRDIRKIFSEVTHALESRGIVASSGRLDGMFEQPVDRIGPPAANYAGSGRRAGGNP